MQIAVIALTMVLSAAAGAPAADPTRLVQPSAGAQTPQAGPAKAPAANPVPRDAVDKPRVADQTPHPRADPQRRTEPPHGRTCFNAAETREKIAAHRLTEPFRLLRSGRFQGDALRARLCRWKQDEFVYEVSVLRRDGRISHVYMNALNGQSVGAPADNDRK